MRLHSGVSGAFFLGLLASGVLLAQTTPPAQTTPSVAGKGELVNQTTPEVRRSEPVVSTETAPQPLGYESDVYCFGYLGDVSEKFPSQISGAENIAEQTDFITGDLLYIDGGYDRGFKVGQQFWVVTPEQEVLHPVSGKTLGRLYQYRGRVEVRSVDERASIVRVTSACTDIAIGSLLKSFEPIPIPLARKSPPASPGDPPSGKAKGRIVFTRDGLVALGAGQMVMVDLGAGDGLQPGDFLTVYRYSQGVEYGIRPVGTYWVNLPPPPGVSIPRTYLGEAAVLYVGDRWAVARLTDSFRLIEVGDEVELK
jgi:hypothetical protein